MAEDGLADLSDLTNTNPLIIMRFQERITSHVEHD
jgi:hypothetical protein